MKIRIVLLVGVLFGFGFSSFDLRPNETASLRVEVNDLRNNSGTVVFALYNREDAFPDEHYKKYLKKMIGKIDHGSASVTFKDLPTGKYAVNILHDENNDGKINKGLVLPKEGIGFSNYQSIGFGNKPNFSKACFLVQKDMKIKVKVIYF